MAGATMTAWTMRLPWRSGLLAIFPTKVTARRKLVGSYMVRYGVELLAIMHFQAVTLTLCVSDTALVAGAAAMLGGAEGSLTV